MAEAIEMKVDRDELVGVLRPTSRFVGKIASQVTSKIRLVVTEGEAYAEATNSRSAARMRMGSVPEFSEDLDVLVHTLIVDALKAMPPGELTLTFGQARVVITGAKKARFEIPVEYSDFPELGLGEAEGMDGQEVDVPELIEALSHSSKFASKDDKKPSLNGVDLRMIEATGGGDPVAEVWAWSTDSHRFYQKQTPLDDFIGNAGDVLVPLGVDGDLKVLFPSTAKLSVGQRLVLTDGDTTFMVQLSEEQFPNLESMVPKEWDEVIEFDRDEAVMALERVAAVTPGNTRVAFKVLDAEIMVRAEGDFGSAEEAWDAETGGTRMELGFNLDYIREGLGVMPNGSITMRLISPIRPAMLEPPSGDRRYMLMPIRVQPQAAADGSSGTATRKKGGAKKRGAADDEE